MRHALALGLVTATLAAGCSSSGEVRALDRSPRVSPSPSLSPLPSPSPSPRAKHPLTGSTQGPVRPVVAVKVDNGVLARRYHRGLDRAPLVYQELVEGGATRFAAVFDAADAAEVGPVRSARESDFMLLRPLGPVPLAFSGANPGTLRTFAAEVQAGRAVDASYDTAPHIYRLAERRRDARNFYTTPAKVAGLRPAAPAVPDIGLRFGPLAATAGAPASRVQVRFSRTSLVTLAYVAARGHYEISQDGRIMPGVAPANVVVQRVRLEKTPYRDVLGLPTPYTVTTGTGEATVLRDGRSVPGTWNRTRQGSGTRFLDARGQDIPLRPGSTWVLLVPQGQPVMTG
jgi:hypothetical protein